MRTEDRLPKLICVTCTEQLKGAYVFKQQCQEVEVCLREYAKHMPQDCKEEQIVDEDAAFTGGLVGRVRYRSGRRDEIGLFICLRGSCV